MPPIIIATRGSQLALAQANAVLGACRKEFPKLEFQLKIIKTTGDKLQSKAPPAPGTLPGRALFTKELETALLEKRADLAVHSLKDLPTDLPGGLQLTAVAGHREDVRDVLIYRIDKGLAPGQELPNFPSGFTVATGSLRRQTQLLALRPDFRAVSIHGNVPTRLQKLAGNPDLDATILAVAGLNRLGYSITRAGMLHREGQLLKLAACVFEASQMLPCVGQGAIGLEIREGDAHLSEICAGLNDQPTFQCVLAERSFLQTMGGGCQTPIGAYASTGVKVIHLRAVAFLDKKVGRAEGEDVLANAESLGRAVAGQILRQMSQPTR